MSAVYTNGKRTNIIIKKIGIGFVFFLFFLFLIDRSKYGYIYNDEPFILTLSHRFTKGDLLLWDEWHPTQLVGFINYFITKIYFMFHSSTDGMILNFRYIYISLWMTIILVIYYRISKYTDKYLLTCFACCYLFLFSSMDILTLSYNFYSIAGVLLCFTFVLTGEKDYEYFLAGIFYAIATLASPYLAIIFILCYLILIIDKLWLKKFKSIYYISLHLFLGVLLSVILFLGFIFLHGILEMQFEQSLY